MKIFFGFPSLVFQAFLIVLFWTSVGGCEALPRDHYGNENISGKLHRKATTVPGLFREAPLAEVQSWLDWKQNIKDEYGLDFSFDYKLLYQSAANSPGQSVSAGGVVDVYGRWLLQDSGSATGTFGFSFDNRHKFTDTSPGSFGDQIGSQWATSDGWGVRQWAWKQWWWEQTFADKQVLLTIGKLSLGSFYEQNRLADGDHYFLDYALADNPAGNQPDEGLGVNVSANVGNWLLSAGVHDANAKTTNFGFETIDKKEFFMEGQACYKLDWGGREGNYRLAYWHQPTGKSNGRKAGGGFLAGLDQEVFKDDKYLAIVAVRYGYEGERLVSTKQYVSTSAVLEGLFGSKGNAIGVGGAWGEPSTRGLRDQYVLETFMRFQLTPTLQFTPDVQLIMNPTDAAGVSNIGVLSFRLVLAL